MDMKEKLVELLYKSAEYAMDFCIDNNCEDCPGRKYGLGCRDWIAADNLIAHGVTVQEWISVKDRLPDDYQKVLICSVIGNQYVAQFFGGFFYVDWLKIGTSHWMPLPEPPKEEAQPDCTHNENGHCIGQKLMPKCDAKNCDRRIER